MYNLLTRYILHNQFVMGLLFIIFFLFLLRIKDILIAVFISYILMSSLIPYVEFLQKQKFPKILAVIIPYIAAIIFILVLILSLIPFLSSQVQVLIERFPSFLNQALAQFGIDAESLKIESLVASEFQTIGGNIFTVSSRVFGGLFSFLTILILSFYFLIEHDLVKNSVSGLFHQKIKALTIINQVEEKLGAWLRGQITLSFIIGILTWFALTLLGLEFALPLAVIAGLLEVVPTIGPIISAIPAVIVAINISPTMPILVIIAYIIIQALENNIVVPVVMQKAVGLNPLIILLAILIGGKLLGILGVLLAIPFVSMILVIVRHMRKPRPDNLVYGH